jgi:serine-type D-Ala-D-Ala carboxypeptidase/endopeptidase (penicillin-binding protein 4)
LKKKGIKEIKGNVFGYDRKWESNNTPRGWIWEDIGNYYGAGASSLNWRENQYDIILKAGEKLGDKATIEKIIPRLENEGLYSEVITAKKGSGDNAFIYLPPYAMSGYVRGTIPLGESSFTISGAMPNAAEQLTLTFVNELKSKNINGVLFAGSYNGMEVEKKDLPIKSTTIFTVTSPPLDSINYWFLKKSINLYGEAFVKTIAYEKLKFGSTDSGIAIIKNFWQQKGIEPSALNIIDGSGLSPANRVTTNALVTVMQYAQQQKWFTSFYNALPEMNGIKMKDGYINGVRSYTGYVKSKTGNEYTFSFIVNNFDGSAGTVREKMWKVLDILK